MKAVDERDQPRRPGRTSLGELLRRRGAGGAVRHSTPAPMTTTGSRSISRRTKRHETSAALAAVDDRVEAVGGASGIVTSDARRPPSPTAPRSIVVEPPRTGTPCIRRRRRRGSSSTKPTTCDVLGRSAARGRTRYRRRPHRRSPRGSCRRPRSPPRDERTSAAGESDDERDAADRVDRGRPAGKSPTARLRHDDRPDGVGRDERPPRRSPTSLARRRSARRRCRGRRR